MEDPCSSDNSELGTQASPWSFAFYEPPERRIIPPDQTSMDVRLQDPPAPHPPPLHPRRGTPMVRVRLPNDDEFATRADVERGIPDCVKSSFMDEREASLRESLMRDIPGRRPPSGLKVLTIYKTGVQMRERAEKLEEEQDRQEDLSRQTRASAAELVTKRANRPPFTVQEAEWSWRPELGLTPEGLVPPKRRQTARKSTGGKRSRRDTPSE